MPRKGTVAKKPVKEKSKGLGDTVEKITKATGIKKAVEKVFPDCGCKERKEWLNKKFPYVNHEPKCMNEEQQTFYTGFKKKFLSDKKQVSVPQEDLQELIQLYNSVFQVNVKGCISCDATRFVKKLDTVYNPLQEEK